MRHDPATIVIMLRGLKMYGMAQAVGELMEQGSPAFEAAVPIISQLLKAETAAHHCHIVETGNDSFRFKASAAATKGRKEKARNLTPA